MPTDLRALKLDRMRAVPRVREGPWRHPFPVTIAPSRFGEMYCVLAQVVLAGQLTPGRPRLADRYRVSLPPQQPRHCARDDSFPDAGVRSRRPLSALGE